MLLYLIEDFAVAIYSYTISVQLIPGKSPDPLLNIAIAMHVACIINQFTQWDAYMTVHVHMKTFNSYSCVMHTDRHDGGYMDLYMETY